MRKQINVHQKIPKVLMVYLEATTPLEMSEHLKTMFCKVTMTSEKTNFKNIQRICLLFSETPQPIVKRIALS